MTRGRFIVFEGGEGMGKSTQAKLLAEYLRTQGLSVEQTREPGGTPGAEAIRELLLAPPGEGWTLEAEALLFAAARADHVARKIRPALDSGAWVICDRFLDSSRAYQGIAGGLGDATVKALHATGSGGLLPDLTIVIDVPIADVEVRLSERDGADSDAIGGRAADYHASVNAAFLTFAGTEPDRFAVIDGSGSMEAVHQRIREVVSNRMAETG
ncbi:MAG: dTMP kinase [Erythrobacter sp.]